MSPIETEKIAISETFSTIQYLDSFLSNKLEKGYEGCEPCVYEYKGIYELFREKKREMNTKNWRKKYLEIKCKYLNLKN